MQEYKVDNKNNFRKNLRYLRTKLRLTQKEFVDVFFSIQNDPIISYSYYSAIENGRGNIEALFDFINDEHKINANYFYLPQHKFIPNLEFIVGQLKQTPIINYSIAANSDRKKVSVVEDVMSQLSEYISKEIIEGRLRAGDQLPSERELATMFNVGRSTLREAMKVLVIVGLLDARQGQGTFISDKPSDFFNNTISWGLLIGEKSLRDMSELRLLMECEVSKLAAERADKYDINELQLVFDVMQTAYDNSDIEAFITADVEFHLAIAKCSHNNVFYQNIMVIRNILLDFSTKAITGPESVDEIFHEHRDIMLAIVARDKEKACSLMKKHISNAIYRYYGEL